MKDQQIEKAMDGIENRIRHIYNCGYQQGYEDGKKAVEEQAEKLTFDDINDAFDMGIRSSYSYQRGLEDAWECAKKIVLSEYNGGMPRKQYDEIFDERQGALVLKNLTAQEAMQKIKEHEERHDFEKEVSEIVNKAEERQTGEWIYTGMKDEWYAREYECSLCGGTMLGESDFCPNCGADMRKESHDNT